MANISQTGLLLHSIYKLQIGTRSRMRVYLSKKYNLDCVEGIGEIVRMNLNQEADWKECKYGLER